MSAPKNDTEFLDRLVDLPPGRWSMVSRVRLFALARRGAAAGELLEALKEALKLAELAEQMTGCRSDDQYVWGVQETICAAILKAESAQENGNE